MLDGVLSVLRWKGDQQAALDRAESAYASLVSGQLGSQLGHLEAEDPESAARIVELLSEADAAALQRVVTAPETCSRLLWDHPGRCDDRDLWRFIADSLAVERARVRPPPGPAVTRWSALGDLSVDPGSGAVTQQPRVEGLLVDSESPSATCFDYSSLYRGGMRLRRYDDPAAKRRALSLVGEAMRGIDALDARLGAFVRRFTLVANVLVDADSPRFTSGSTAHYIGRSLFCNVHLESADVELLAESLVHEAIHSLLYMHEACDPWVTDEFSENFAVESPWTGATLVVRPFLQACFVWFGLAHFWSLAQGAAVFRSHRVAERLAIARRGFLDGPLPERISEQVPHVALQVLDLVGEMQAAVAAQHGSEPAGRRSAPA